MNKRTIILLIILLLAVLLKLSFWADQRSFEVQGVVRMVAHPDGTLFLLTNDEIIRASPDGEILSNWPLAGMGITEPVADLAFGLEGQLLVGLIESQEIRRYTADGKFAGTVRRMPSPERVGVPGQHLRNFKFARDVRTGVLYVADSNHHRIQIYPGGDGVPKVLTAPSGAVRASAEAEEDEVGEGAEAALDPSLPFRYPNSLSIDGERLYATDTDNHRIIIFHLDGALDRIVPTTRASVNLNIFPVHFARMDDQLFVINRGPMFVGGEVAVLDLETLRSRPLYPRGLVIDPLDILVVDDDVLIADGETRNILRYSDGGYYLGFFGKSSLQEVLRSKEQAYRGYILLRVLSIGGILLVLVGLLAMKRSERRERVEQGLPDVHRPLPALQEFLGPVGSTRRAALLWMLPGLGYVAAGRLLRAIILVPPLGLLVIVLLVTLVLWWTQGVTLLPAVLLVAVVTGAYWSGMVQDANRLNEGADRQKRKFDLLDLLKSSGLPLVTVAAGIISQLMWENLIRAVPAITMELQHMVAAAMVSLGLARGDLVAFDAISVVGRFVGWGGTVAAMFGVLAWRLGWERSRAVGAAAVGLLTGMLSWVFTSAVPGAMLGGAYYEPLSQGLLLGLAAWLLFRGPVMGPTVVLLAVAASWVGSMLNLFLLLNVDLMFLRFKIACIPPGAVARTNAIVVEAYCIHLAMLLFIRAREVRQSSPRTD
jgi:hypothetical protein